MVPKEDRQGISTPRIPGAINPVMKNGYFEVITTGGIIDRKFRMENLGKFNGTIDTSNKEPTTLRNAAIFYNDNYHNLGKAHNLATARQVIV